jgi:hypothetical protein
MGVLVVMPEGSYGGDTPTEAEIRVEADLVAERYLFDHPELIGTLVGSDPVLMAKAARTPRQAEEI